MDRAEAVAEIRRSAIYRVGVWFTRLLFSSFGLVMVLFLLAVLGGLGDAAINQWVPFAFGVLVFLVFAGIPISILFNIELASHMGWRLGADNPALLILLLRTFVRDVLPFRSGGRSDQLSTSAATGEAGPGDKDLSERIASAEGSVEARFWESRTYRSAIGNLRALALFGLIAPIVVMALMVGRASTSVALIIWVPLWLGAAIVLGVALRKVATVVRDIRALGHEEQPWALAIGRLSQDVWRLRDERDVRPSG